MTISPMPGPPNAHVIPALNEVPLGQRRTPMGWLVATLVLAGFFSFGLPAMSDSLPQTRPIADGERLWMVGGSVAPPSGWDVSLPDAAVGYPVVTRGGTEATIFAGMWNGDSDDLVERVTQWLVDPRATVSASESLPGLSTEVREVYRVDISGSQANGSAFVVREGGAVVVVSVRVDGARSDELDRDLEAIIESLSLDEIAISFDERSAVRSSA